MGNVHLPWGSRHPVILSLMAGIPRRRHARRRANRWLGRIHASRAPDLTPHWEPYRGISKPSRHPRPRWPYICADAETAAHARRDGNRLSVYACVFLPACLAPLSAPRPASTASLSLRLAPARRPCCASSWPAAGRLDPALERLPCACRAVQAALRTPVIATAESGMISISGNHRPAGSLCATAQGRLATNASSRDECRNA